MGFFVCLVCYFENLKARGMNVSVKECQIITRLQALKILVKKPPCEWIATHLCSSSVVFQKPSAWCLSAQHEMQLLGSVGRSWKHWKLLPNSFCCSCEWFIALRGRVVKAVMCVCVCRKGSLRLEHFSRVLWVQVKLRVSACHMNSQSLWWLWPQLSQAVPLFPFRYQHELHTALTSSSSFSSHAKPLPHPQAWPLSVVISLLMQSE